MPDDLKNRGPADGSRINLSEDHEVRYWTKALGVDESTLRQAVAAAGTSAAAIRDYLGNKKAG